MISLSSKAFQGEERSRNAEVKYISLRSKLGEAVGIRWASKILKLIRHFYSAPKVQVSAYIAVIVRDEGVNFSN